MWLMVEEVEQEDVGQSRPDSPGQLLRSHLERAAQDILAQLPSRAQEARIKMLWLLLPNCLSIPKKLEIAPWNNAAKKISSSLMILLISKNSLRKGGKMVSASLLPSGSHATISNLRNLIYI